MNVIMFSKCRMNKNININKMREGGNWNEKSRNE